MFLLLCFTLFSMSILTGCSLFTRNTQLYYDTIVSTLEKDGKTISITKKELIEAYSNYGAMYEQYYGYSAKEAYDMSLKIVENRKITVSEAEDIVESRGGLTKKEKAYIWQETMDALIDNFNSYYNDIVGEESSSSDEETITFEDYSKNAKIENGQIVRTSIPTKVLDGFEYDESNAHDFTNKEDLNVIYENFIELVTSGNEDYQKAFEKYKQALISSEQGLNLSQDSPSLFAREIERLCDIMYENYMVEVYSEEYENYDEVSSVTINDILSLYSSKVRRGYVQYEIENDSSYDSTIQEDAGSV